MRIGPGARWMEVAAALGEHGWALSVRRLRRRRRRRTRDGGRDRLPRARARPDDRPPARRRGGARGRLHRADGCRRRARTCSGRSAAPAANVGIVTRFEFEVDEVGEIGWAQLAFQVDDVEEFLEGYGRTMEAAPRDVTLFLIIGGTRAGPAAGRPAVRRGRLRRPRHDHRAPAALRRARARSCSSRCTLTHLRRA